MKMFKRILCPVDFSESSRQALHYARIFSVKFDSELVLMHVATNIMAAYSSFLPEFADFRIPSESELLDQFDEFVNGWSKGMKKVVRTGTPYLEILNFAKEEQCDLIIAGAKGHTRCERLFLGTTVEKVARISCSPVLRVHPKAVGLPINKILVPIDFSAAAYTILPTVATLAERFNADIYLLHVIEIGQHLDSVGQRREYECFQKIQERLDEEWEMHRFLREIKHLSIKKFIRHHVGPAAYGILEFAQDWDVDLIAMSTHGRTGLAKVMMGSVTEKVMRISPYPVLSIRSLTTTANPRESAVNSQAKF